MELYYTSAVTSWLFVASDLQIVLPDANNILESGPRLQSVDTVVIGGLRVFMRI